MRKIKVFIIFLSYILCWTFAPVISSDRTVDDAYELAAACPYRFNVGCFLDVLEKVCGAVEEAESCVKEGSHDHFGEMTRTITSFIEKSPESIHRCCCTKAFEHKYENCKSPNSKCKAAIDKHITKNGLLKHLKNLIRGLNEPNKENCQKALAALKWGIKSIQKTRGELLTEDCKMLAPMNPISQCIWDEPKGKTILVRQDLKCDTMVWQFKEMGAIDTLMENCPNAPDTTETQTDNHVDEKLLDESQKDIYQKAASCPHRFNMGCTLDVLEKACEATKEVNACISGDDCDTFDETHRFIGALVPKNYESINKCCCTKAYKSGGYENCETPNTFCSEAINKYLMSNESKKHWINIRRCVKIPGKENCQKALASINWIMDKIQLIRGEMWQVDGCQILAPPEPLSKCGWDVKPQGRPIERADLYCDTIIWQYKEMGAQDSFMSECSDAPTSSKNTNDDGQNEEENPDFLVKELQRIANVEIDNDDDGDDDDDDDDDKKKRAEEL